jgi:hypothetical protein
MRSSSVPINSWNRSTSSGSSRKSAPRRHEPPHAAAEAGPPERAQGPTHRVTDASRRFVADGCKIGLERTDRSTFVGTRLAFGKPVTLDITLDITLDDIELVTLELVTSVTVDVRASFGTATARTAGGDVA